MRKDRAKFVLCRLQKSRSDGLIHRASSSQSVFLHGTGTAGNRHRDNPELCAWLGVPGKRCIEMCQCQSLPFLGVLGPQEICLCRDCYCWVLLQWQQASGSCAHFLEQSCAGGSGLTEVSLSWWWGAAVCWRKGWRAKGAEDTDHVPAVWYVSEDAVNSTTRASSKDKHVPY